MGGQQSRSTVSGGGRVGLPRQEIETLIFENAKRLQHILTSDNRKRGIPRADLNRLAGEIFSRQMEFSKGNTQYIEGIRKQFDSVYTNGFQPVSPEAKIRVRTHVDELIGKLKTAIEMKFTTEVPERRIDGVQQEQFAKKERSAQRNARARASATRRVRDVRSVVQRMKGGVVSWFQSRSTEATTVPFRHYTRSIRGSKRQQPRAVSVSD